MKKNVIIWPINRQSNSFISRLTNNYVSVFIKNLMLANSRTQTLPSKIYKKAKLH